MTTDLQNAIRGEPGCAVVVTSADGRVIQWNDHAETMFGYEAAEAVGRAVHDLIVLPDQLADEQQMVETTLEDESCEYECVYRRQNGSLVYVASANRLVSQPDSALQFIVKSMRDVTEFAIGQAMDRLASSYGMLLEAMPDAIIMTDLTGKIVLANGLAETMFGYERGEMLGLAIEALVPERMRAAHHGSRNSYFAQPKVRTMGSALELHAVRKDGSEFPADISLSPLQAKDASIFISAIRERARIPS